MKQVKLSSDTWLELWRKYALSETFEVAVVLTQHELKMIHDLAKFAIMWSPAAIDLGVERLRDLEMDAFEILKNDK